jgi:hypothetical protein
VVQVGFGFVFTALVAPALIAPDLAHDALVLVLARPLGRREYVLGKLCALALLLSAVTWVPGVLLFLIQASLAGGAWFVDNLRIAGAIAIGSWIWIATAGVVALAVSAWVRWKPVATAAVLGVFLVGKGRRGGHQVSAPTGGACWWSTTGGDGLRGFSARRRRAPVTPVTWVGIASSGRVAGAVGTPPAGPRGVPVSSDL